MPGVERLSIDELLRVGEQALELGVPLIDLFGVPDPAAKTADGRIAWDEDGIIQRAIRALKSHFPELGVMTDQALDPYTTHGQDGLIDESGYILNDETIEALIRQGWDGLMLRPGDGFVGMAGFGASAPAPALYRHFGITAERAAELAGQLIQGGK